MHGQVGAGANVDALEATVLFPLEFDRAAKTWRRQVERPTMKCSGLTMNSPARTGSNVVESGLKVSEPGSPCRIPKGTTIDV
jgi:hypothetical protein